MTDQLAAFAIFWGIWLLVPMLIDGGTSLTYLIGVWTIRRRQVKFLDTKIAFYPPVTIVVPVYNGARTIGACLESILKQTYPRDKLEVIVVNNMSTDNTFGIFQELQHQNQNIAMNWISTASKGKSFALNAGYHSSNGLFLCNIDADVELHPDAIHNAMKYFETFPEAGAITAAIEVLPEEEDVGPLRRILAECEYLEYYSSFRIGRQYQTATNSLFTLAGAFSMFRREILLQTFMYSKQTVSEDTHLTFEIHQKFKNSRIACVPEVLAYVTPTASLASFYAQRVRWQRGQLEVAALHPHLLSGNPFRIRGVSPARLLVIDHTLAFPRVVWTFLLPLMYFFGYSLSLVISATIAMYASYIFLEGVAAFASYLLADRGGKDRIRRYWWIFFIMPAYRFTLFWFRLGGFVSVLMEPAVWRTDAPWVETRLGYEKTKQTVATALLQVGRTLGLHN